MTELREINAENFWDIIDLKTTPEQEEFVASVAVSIAQSKVQPECIPLAVYDGETPVGFAMYCVDRDDGEYWLYRLLTDARFQRRGYGRSAMEQVLERIKVDRSRHKVYLGVHPQNTAAVALYESLGFRFNGQIFGGEHIMLLTY